VPGAPCCLWPLPVCRLPGRGGGSAEGTNAQAGCDKSRVKTKKKEKQNDFLTDTCHSRLGGPRSTCSKSTADRQHSPPGCPLNPIRQAPPPASRRRPVDALPPLVGRDARLACPSKRRTTDIAIAVGIQKRLSVANAHSQRKMPHSIRNGNSVRHDGRSGSSIAS
jgi:hypothetical protein